uniref:Reverse transcriptase domain-containing protein n=1 Tax=Elaeophora elaphi TaxID=1147741 RepID=A0A0R3S4T6_9BILA
LKLEKNFSCFQDETYRPIRGLYPSSEIKSVFCKISLTDPLPTISMKNFKPTTEKPKIRKYLTQELQLIDAQNAFALLISFPKQKIMLHLSNRKKNKLEICIGICLFEYYVFGAREH